MKHCLKYFICLVTLAGAALTQTPTDLCAQQFKVIYNFGANYTPPANPGVPGILSQSPGGDLISSAPGAESGLGSAAYELSLSGDLTTLQRFSYDESWSGLTLATDERFHGANQRGGKYGFGYAYHISPTPNSTVVHDHDFTGGADGAAPQAPPIQSSAGDFYGTTNGENQDPDDVGTIYKITKDGEYSVLHRFDGTDGQNPVGPLIQGTDGSFYGATPTGGSMSNGTIYRINADGSFKVLHNFTGTDGSGCNGPLVQATDGNLYGLTSSGGGGIGVAFKITPGGTYTLLHSFGPEGALPMGGLIQATDGNFYGITYAGGGGDWGSLFKMTPGGTVTQIYDFVGNNGVNAMGTFLQHTNGKLYGQSYAGGKYGDGILFEYNAGLAPFVTYLNVYGIVGSKVVILGQGFKAGETTVSFNGVASSAPEIHPTYIKAIVPAGATTGLITVTTGSSTLESNKAFVVH